MSNGLMGIGFMLILLGGTMADSQGQGIFYAIATVIVGCGLIFVGLYVEKRKEREEDGN